MKERMDLVPYLALAGALQPIWLLGGAVVFGTYRAGYEPVAHAISELGQQSSPNAVVWNLVGFGGAATLLLLFALAVRATFGAGWLFRGVLIGAVALYAGAAFSCDAGCPPAPSSPAGILHNVAGLSYFAMTALLPFVAWRTFRTRSEWADLAPLSLATGVLLVALFVLSPLTFGIERQGLGQRVFLAPAGLWSIAVAMRVYRLAAGRVPTRAAA